MSSSIMNFQNLSRVLLLGVFLIFSGCATIQAPSRVSLDKEYASNPRVMRVTFHLFSETKKGLEEKLIRMVGSVGPYEVITNRVDKIEGGFFMRITVQYDMVEIQRIREKEMDETLEAPAPTPEKGLVF